MSIMKENQKNQNKGLSEFADLIESSNLSEFKDNFILQGDGISRKAGKELGNGMVYFMDKMKKENPEIFNKFLKSLREFKPEKE